MQNGKEEQPALTTGAWSSILKSLLNPKTENLIMSLRSNDQEWN